MAFMLTEVIICPWVKPPYIPWTNRQPVDNKTDLWHPVQSFDVRVTVNFTLILRDYPAPVITP